MYRMNHILVKKVLVALSLVFTTMLFHSAWAAANTSSASAKSDPQQLIQAVSSQLLKRVSAAPKKSAPADFYFKLVEEIVAPYVDFDLIAKRVMARAYVSASAEQRQNFTKTFRNTLLNTYSKAIANYGDQKIVMLPFSGVQSQGLRERATVKMQINAKTGEVIPITYALYKNDQGLWKLENIIINGVNLGLTFRNQFQEALRDNQGDLNKATMSWQQMASSNGSSK